MEELATGLDRDNGDGVFKAPPSTRRIISSTFVRDSGQPSLARANIIPFRRQIENGPSRDTLLCCSAVEPCACAPQASLLSGHSHVRGSPYSPLWTFQRSE